MFKGLGDIASLMRQAPAMLGKMQAAKDELRAKRLTGTAGGGLVEVEVNGMGEVQRITLADSLVERKDREMMEELLVAALSSAQARVAETRMDAIQMMTSGLDFPGMDEAKSQMLKDMFSDESSTKEDKT